MMGTLLQDIRYGFRMLLKKPSFTITAILALALGVGATSAVFSVVNAVMLRQLPYKNAERIVMVWEQNRTSERRQNVVSPANFLDWQDQSNSFDEMAAFYDSRANLTGTGEPEEIPGQASTGNLFTLLGAQAALGRTYTTEDAEPGRDNVCVLSYGLWQRRFGASPQVIGQTIMLNGKPHTVIGVMPADFKWFIKENSQTGKPAEMWRPFKLTEEYRTPERGRGRWLSVAARLKPGVTAEQAQAEMSGLAARLEQQQAEFNTGWGVNVTPLRQQLAGELKTSLLVLLGAVAFVLLIACANVANLMLARSASRQREMAIRTALGAGRLRVVRQLLTESVLLALVGGGLGLLLAAWGVDMLVALSPQNLIGAETVGLNLPVLGFTLAVSLLTGIIFGLAPALEASKLNLSETLNEAGKSGMGSPRSRRLRNAFVVAEIALALVLLVGAGLMIKSFMRLQAVDPGFDPGNLLTMRVLLPRAKYADDGKRVNFFRQAVERMKALPGVSSVGIIDALPFASMGSATDFAIEGKPAPAPGEEPDTDVRVTDENYFRTMNIPVLSGRTFTEQEAVEERHVAVINQALARKYFAGENPLGKRIIVNMKLPPVPTEIIGIVGDAKYGKLEGETRAMVYWPHPELASSSMTIVVRAEGDPLRLASAAAREIQAIDKDQPIADVRTMGSWLSESVSRTRFGTLLLATFAALALLLSAIGIYGVMSYSVTQRTQEIGIRMALGAQRGDVMRMILGQGMGLTLVGVALGLGASFALTRVMASLLFGISATDPATFTLISLLLMGVAFLSTYLPARKATRVDPMVALRYE
ncbi:MAG TPA: ABC transporter permease [Pyrinomonadaceae bacterium]|jgi:putative ABC transport system permease protein|nr:ABC transporter permease [Pyrinomonadaceae bacterium]